MQVQNNSVDIALLNTRRTQPARPNVDYDDKAARQTSTEVTAVTGHSTNNAVTGTTGSRLSAETTAELIQGNQEVSTASTKSTLPIGVQHHLDDIANDPTYAGKYAKLRGTSGDLIFLGHNPFPKNGAPASEWVAAKEKIDARVSQVQQVTQNRNSYYESLVAQGTPPAEINLKLFEFDTNLPDSYDNAIGFSDYSTTHATWSNYSQAAHDYLQNAITDANSSQVTG